MLIIALALAIIAVAVLILFLIDNTIAQLIAICGIASAVIFTCVGFSNQILASVKPLTITEDTVIIYNDDYQKLQIEHDLITSVYVNVIGDNVKIEFVTRSGSFFTTVGKTSYEWRHMTKLNKVFPSKLNES